MNSSDYKSLVAYHNYRILYFPGTDFVGHCALASIVYGALRICTICLCILYVCVLVLYVCYALSLNNTFLYEITITWFMRAARSLAIDDH
jgi:hypothetical protein